MSRFRENSSLQEKDETSAGGGKAWPKITAKRLLKLFFFFFGEDGPKKPEGGVGSQT